MATLPLLLFGVFARLRAAGMELGVRDYLQGLEALARGQQLEPFHGLRDMRPLSAMQPPGIRADDGEAFTRVVNREPLIWLCETLWARTREERDLVRSVVTSFVHAPAHIVARAATSAMPQTRRPLPGEATTEPVPHVPVDAPPPSEEGRTNGAGDENETGRSKGDDTETDDTTREKPGRIGVEIVRKGHMPLADVDSLRPFAPRTILSPPEWISSAWLLALWRRFMMPIGVVDPVEVDVDATLARAAATGVLLAPVMKKRRRNAASLAVLLDTGAGMAPWLPALERVEASLHPSQSRLKRLTLRYFSLAPGASLFESASLRHRVPSSAFLSDVHDQPLLIFGEAGAARRRELTSRRRHVQGFFAAAQLAGVRPIVWVNPMPRRHWDGSLMADVARQPGVQVFEFLPEELLRAVDVLRGAA